MAGAATTTTPRSSQGGTGRWFLALVVGLMLLSAWRVGGAAAQLFKWVDENGVVHFTDNYQELPPRYRALYKDKLATPPLREGSKEGETRPAEGAAGAAGVSKEPQAPPRVAPGGAGSAQPADAALAPEEIVSRILTQEFAMAFQQRNVPALLSLLTRDFSFQAEAGATLSQQAYGARLERYFARRVLKNVEVRSLHVQRQGGSISARFRLLTAYDLDERQPRMRKALYAADFRQEGGTWRIQQLSEQGVQDYADHG
ncbi:MAG: DUF4124 domain-containing protein [Candidatus Tectomicrobia bacterium]|nr:DUF4124 domain-containing protein [Candidatus Tectomicrobia bacterium]